MMKLEEFEDCLDLYGADLTRWPEAKAGAGHACLQSSELARIMLDDARQLDSALDDFRIALPTAAFEARLLDLSPVAPAALPMRRKSGWLDLRIFSTAVASLACAAFGMVIGFQTVQSVQTEVDADAFLTASATTLSTDFWSGEEG